MNAYRGSTDLLPRSNQKSYAKYMRCMGMLQREFAELKVRIYEIFGPRKKMAAGWFKKDYFQSILNFGRRVLKNAVDEEYLVNIIVSGRISDVRWGTCKPVVKLMSFYNEPRVSAIL